MSDAITNTVPSAPIERKRQRFDVVLTVFVVVDFLFAMLAGLFATYRVSSSPLALEVIAVMMLLPLKILLCVVSVIYLIVRAIRRRANAYSVASFMAVLASVFFVSIAFNLGQGFGRHLLATTGVNARVAKECLLIAESELCKTDVWVMAESGTWTPREEELSYLTPVAREIQSQCPTICGLKPTHMFFGPEYVNLELHGGFDHFGYRFLAEGTNWILNWYTERGPHQELLRLARHEPSLTITN